VALQSGSGKSSHLRLMFAARALSWIAANCHAVLLTFASAKSKPASRTGINFSNVAQDSRSFVRQSARSRSIAGATFVRHGALHYWVADENGVTVVSDLTANRPSRSVRLQAAVFNDQSTPAI
jgi:hypothetical protein